VATEESAAEVRAMLKAVVDSGTGRAAGLAAFEVGGKSGTARRVVNGRYSRDDYDATFAGMFPMSDPQLVIVARLIAPRTQIFGGLVAGPMVREVLLGAMAASDAALDLKVLARVAKAVELPSAIDSAPPVRVLSARDEPALPELDAVPPPREVAPSPGRVVVTLPFAAEREATGPRQLTPVPSVRGLSVREAVRTLHAAGFQVKLARGVRGRTQPSAGSSAREGSVVVLERGT
jgi:hypothetical protein